MLKRLVKAGIAGLLTIGMLGLPGISAIAGDTDNTSNTSGTSGSANATVKKDPYTVVQVTEHQDGSGFGTADAPYVTKEHGYKVGDEGPKDGVVTSGDIAWYKAHVTFLAAKHRTVTVKFDDLGDALTATKPACPSGHFVSVETLSDACRYTIPSGVSESVDLTLNLTAKDTGGKTVSADPKIVVERSDGGLRGMKLGRLTVTSIPLMDVYLDCHDDERFSETSVRFSIETRALHPAGVSNDKGFSRAKGFSRLAPYSASLDLTGLPNGISVNVDGKDFTPTAGIVNLPEKAGNQSVTVSGLPEPNPGEQRKYDVHIIVSSSLPDWKGQPGDGLGRDDSTLDYKIGARAGVSYPNNDWLMVSTTGLTKYNSTDKEGIGDELHFDRPYTSTQTKWDDGNLTWSNATSSWFDRIWLVEGESVVKYAYGHNMEFTAKAHLNFGNLTGDECSDDNPCVTYYQWGDGLTMTSLPTATDENGNQLSDGTYRIMYGTSFYPFNYTIDNVGYHFDSYPDAFRAGLTDTPPTDLTTIHQIVILRTGSQPVGWLSWGMKATGLGAPDVEGVGTNSAGHTQLNHNAIIMITNPRPFESKVTGGYVVDRSHRMINNSKDDDVEAGDRVTGIWQISLSNVPTVTQPITTSVDICLPKGLNQASLKADGWTVEETSSKECATKWHLTYIGKATVTSYYSGGLTADMADYNLPVIRWSGTIQPTAQGTLTPSLTGTVHMDAWRNLSADTQAISNTFNLPVSLIPANVSIVDTGMTDDIAPTHDLGADDPVTWTVTTTAGAPASAMLALPDPSDCKQLYNSGKGPDGDWHEYDRGCTTYRGKERLKEQPSVDAAMTLGDVSFQYTTVGITSLDPSAYTWQSWDDIKDKTTITGIKATIGSSDNSAAMTRINLTLAGMTDEGSANVWAGAPYRDGKELTSTSWPGVIKHLNATIIARVFKDIDEDGMINSGVPYSDGRDATVDVYKSDENGTQGALVNRLSRVGNGSGRVKLSSGWYLVKAHIDGSKANGEIKDADGQSIYNIGSTNTYYGKSDNTRATTPTSRLIHVNAGDTANADFGWMADMPRLSVTQTETLGDCNGASCTATVNAMLSNDGDRTIPEDTLIHSTLSAGSANDDWSYSTLSLDWEHTVNGYLLRDNAGHYWEHSSNNFIRNTMFDNFDTVEAVSAEHGSNIWAVTKDGRVLSDRCWGGGINLGRVCAVDPPEGRKFIHVRPFYSDGKGDSALAQTDDGALWEYHEIGEKKPKFTKLDVGDAQFDLTKQPKTLGYQLMLVDTQHRLWLMDNKTNTLSTKGIFGAISGWNSTPQVPVPFEGGPTSVKDIATLLGGDYGYPQGKYKTDVPVAAVVDADGRLWLCHKHSTKRYAQDDDLTVVWDKTDVTGVAQLAGVFDYYWSGYYGATHTVWYLGEDGGLYRFDPDTLMDWRNTDNKRVDTSLLESASAVHTPGKPVRVQPDKTFSRLMDMSSGNPMFGAITPNGRLYTWGDNNSSSYGVTIGDHTMQDKSSDAPVQTMTATPSNTDGMTTTYKLPFPLAPGDTVTLTRSLTVPRGDADSIATTQTWADGELTPYKGITGLDKPTPPDTAKLTSADLRSDGSIPGNESCLVGVHKYTAHTAESGYDYEDQCEQNGVAIPALDKGETIITGGISGIAWLDENGDGIRQPSEKVKQGVKVRVTDKAGKTLQTAETTANGGYEFTGLMQGEYTIWMADSSTKLMWTIQHAGSDTTVDSDINPGLENYGSAAVTLTKEQPNAEHVDGGLTARQTVGELPHSGRIGIVFLIALCLLLMAAGVVHMRFHKPGKHVDSSKQVKVVPW